MCVLNYKATCRLSFTYFWLSEFCEGNISTVSEGITDIANNLLAEQNESVIPILRKLEVMQTAAPNSVSGSVNNGGKSTTEFIRICSTTSTSAPNMSSNVLSSPADTVLSSLNSLVVSKESYGASKYDAALKKEDGKESPADSSSFSDFEEERPMGERKRPSVSPMFTHSDNNPRHSEEQSLIIREGVISDSNIAREAQVSNVRMLFDEVYNTSKLEEGIREVKKQNASLVARFEDPTSANCL